MLNKLPFIIVMLLWSSQVDAQAWYEQVIRNEVKVQFPILPEHKLIDSNGKEAYISQSDGCHFMAGIAFGVIEDYDSYVKASDSEQVIIALRILEGVADGKVRYRNQYLISMKRFRSNENYFGLDVEYATLEPSRPESRKRYSTLLLIKNTLYIFDCWYMDDKDHIVEREKFFKSISIKN